jgi:HK97 family phage major capsid protein
VTRTTTLTPGQRHRLASLGYTADLVGKVWNRALPVPKNADELEEMLNDGSRIAPVVASKESLKDFVLAYAREQQGDGTELRRMVTEEVQRGVAQMLTDNAVDKDAAEGIKRLNLDPQSGRASMLTSHRQGTAYNANAAGAVLDNEFKNAADYFHTAWHLNKNPDAHAKMARIRNAYSSVVPSEGGFLVPETLRSQLLQIALESSVVRPRATVIPMDSARVPIPMIDSTTNAGSVFGGMISYWAEESAMLQESNPKFGRVVLDASKLTGLAVVPNELLNDSLVSFATLVETLWPKVIAFDEDRAFMAGDGVGKPLGWMGAGNPAAIAVAKETNQPAGTIVLQNILKAYARMLPGSLNSAIWVVSQEVIPELYTMAISVGTGGAPVMLVNAAGPGPATMLGRPIVISEKAGRKGARGDVAFVDLSYYLIGDRQTMSADSSTDYKFGSDQTTYRIIQRVDGRPWLKTPITPANGGDTLSPFVEIAARA